MTPANASAHRASRAISSGAAWCCGPRNRRSSSAGLDAATIDARRELSGVTELERTLDYGSFRVRDRVRLFPKQRSEIHTAAGCVVARQPDVHHDRGALARRVVPALCLRGRIRGRRKGGLDDVTVALRQQAYEGADLDTVVRIRALAESGRLD